jgi:hypothetical protein
MYINMFSFLPTNTDFEKELWQNLVRSETTIDDLVRDFLADGQQLITELRMIHQKEAHGYEQILQLHKTELLNILSVHQVKLDEILHQSQDVINSTGQTHWSYRGLVNSKLSQVLSISSA